MRALVAHVFPLLPVTFGPTAWQQPAEVQYVRDAEGWLRVDAQGAFRVDPHVISVMFREGIQGLEGLLATMARRGPVDPLLAALSVERSNRLGIHDLRIPPGVDVFDALARLEATGCVELAKENTFGTYSQLPDDTLFGQQWHLRNTGQNGGLVDADIDADEAWEISTGDPSVVIAVLDSGVSVTHVDLANNVWTNPGEIPGNGIDDDANGFVDDVQGWDFENGDCDVTSSFPHGTWTSGVACAHTNNAIGVAGVAGGFAPGTGCRIMPLVVGGSAPTTSIIDDAIVYAVDQGARVISLSFSIAPDPAIDLALQDAWLNHDVFVSCSVGNTGGAATFPSTHAQVVAVAGTTNQDTRWTSSNMGPDVWIAAPAVSVYTTAPGHTYQFVLGTSFASPQVAGTAALLYSAFPALKPDHVKEVLKQSADDVMEPGFDTGTGWGRLNARAALDYVASTDCDGNGVFDLIDIDNGTLTDANGDLFPDECAPVTDNVCAGDGSYPTDLGGCPCGLNAPSGSGEGCLNSGGAGGFLVDAYPSSTSLSVDNLRLDATHPARNSGLLLLHTSIFNPGIATTGFDGIACVGGGPRVLPGSDNGLGQAFGDVDLVDGDGVRNLGSTAPGSGLYGLVNAVFPGYFVSGVTYYAQYWYRDTLCGPPPAPCVTLCTTPPPAAANFTNAVTWMVTP